LRIQEGRKPSIEKTPPPWGDFSINLPLPSSLPWWISNKKTEVKSKDMTVKVGNNQFGAKENHDIMGCQ